MENSLVVLHLNLFTFPEVAIISRLHLTIPVQKHKSYVKTRVHRGFTITDVVSISFLLEIDLLIYTKILHKCTNVTCTF